MIKKHTSTALLILTILCTALGLTSCEPIGYKIEHETKLAEAVVTGNIYSMVPVQGYLFVQNGYIFTKAFNGTASWEQITNPSGKSVIALASDDANLYAKDTEGNIWVTPVTGGKISAWEQVAVSGTAGTVFLFDNGLFNNTNGDTSGRHAYFRDETGVKKLNGTASPVAVTANGAATTTLNCVSLGGIDYFTDSFMAATDGVNIFSVASEARSDSKDECCTLRYKKPTDASWTAISGTTGKAVTYLFWNGTELLVGMTKNYEKWTVTGNIPVSGTAADDTASTIGTHGILGIWEYGSTRYASIYDTSSSAYNGLWAQPQDESWDKQ